MIQQCQVILIVCEYHHEGQMISAYMQEASLERMAEIQLQVIDAHIDRLRIEELFQPPRPRDCESIRHEPCNCPKDRARGPPGSGKS